MPLAHLYRVVQDVAGNIIPNVSITVTRSDTAQPALLWADPGGLIPLTQPVLSDPQYGSLSVYVSGGEYDVFPSKVGYLFDPLRRITVVSVQSGTFPVTTEGFAAPSPSGTASYLRNGNIVLLNMPFLSGTSNSTDFRIYGLIPELEAAVFTYQMTVITAASVVQIGSITVEHLNLRVYPNVQSDDWALTGAKTLWNPTVIYRGVD